MLSVIEQRAGQWGALAAAAASVANSQSPVTAGDDQAGTAAAYGNVDGDQHSVSDGISYDHPSVRIFGLECTLARL